MKLVRYSVPDNGFNKDYPAWKFLEASGQDSPGGANPISPAERATEARPLVVEFLSLRTFNAGSVVLNDWTESDNSRSYLSFSARKFSAAIAS